MVRSIFVAGILVVGGMCWSAGAAHPIAHWGFDAQQGSVAYDGVGSNDGTIYGATRTAGINGGALNFDGSGDYVDVGDRFNELELPFSIAGWVYAPGRDVHKNIFSSNDTGSGSSYYSGFYFSVQGVSNALGVSYGDGTGRGSSDRRTKVSNAAVPTNCWTFVAAVVRGPTDMSLYINDQEVSGEYSGSGGAMVHNSRNALIGYSYVHEANYFSGKIDELMLFDRGLSSEEVEGLYDEVVPEPASAVLFIILGGYGFVRGRRVR